MRKRVNEAAAERAKEAVASGALDAVLARIADHLQHGAFQARGCSFWSWARQGLVSLRSPAEFSARISVGCALLIAAISCVPRSRR